MELMQGLLRTIQATTEPKDTCRLWSILTEKNDFEGNSTHSWSLPVWDLPPFEFDVFWVTFSRTWGMKPQEVIF
jgi:hypothetical protein